MNYRELRMKDINTFPILSCYKEWRTHIPYKLLAPNLANAQSRAKRNHSQSLEWLSNRGGLTPFDAYCIIRDLDTSEAIRMGMTNKLAMEIIDEWILHIN